MKWRDVCLSVRMRRESWPPGIFICARFDGSYCLSGDVAGYVAPWGATVGDYLATDWVAV